MCSRGPLVSEKWGHPFTADGVHWTPLGSRGKLGWTTESITVSGFKLPKYVWACILPFSGDKIDSRVSPIAWGGNCEVRRTCSMVEDLKPPPLPVLFFKVRVNLEEYSNACG